MKRFRYIIMLPVSLTLVAGLLFGTGCTKEEEDPVKVAEEAIKIAEKENKARIAREKKSYKDRKAAEKAAGVEQPALVAEVSMEDFIKLSLKASQGKELLDILGPITKVEYDAFKREYDKDPKLFLFLDQKETLSVAEAKVLAGFKGSYLMLNGLESLDQDHAEQLKKWPGRVLMLNGIKKLSPNTAGSLADFKGERLFLDGLTTLTPEVAKALAWFHGKLLSLRGMRNIPPAAAAELAEFKGAVSIKLVHDKPSRAALSAEDRNKLKGLVKAISKGDAAVIGDYLKKGGDPDFGEKGNTLLMESAYQKQPKLVALLIKAGANVNAANGSGDTPLSFAMTVPMFSNDPKLKDPVKIRKLVTALIEAGAKLNVSEALAAKNSTPLHLAAKSGDLKLVKLMLAKGADVNAVGRLGAKPLTEAVNKCHPQVVKLLIAKGAELNPKNPGPGDVPLIQAISQGSMAGSMYAFNARRAGKKPSKQGLLQVKKEWYRLVDLLIKKGANIEAKDERGWPVLFSAINGGDPDMLKRVLAHKPKLDVRGPKGESALHFLAQSGRMKEDQLLPLAKILIKSGAKRKGKRADGKTATQIAKGMGYEKLAKVLR
ncbi:MAG: ankyrin repeat domain-containing protein [Deltaproteobacteria bacterium]|nr:ankyrin repeat domain-containing protein [Deltaproteobacteria bacterium]